MAAEGSTPGNGSTSPFGNGAGATQTAGSSKGSNDFTTNPTGNGTPPGSLAEPANRPQKGRADGWNPDSVPKGGRLPFVDPSSRAGASLQPVGSGKKPYRLNGGEGGASSSGGAAPMVLSQGPAEAGSVPGEEGAE